MDGQRYADEEPTSWYAASGGRREPEAAGSRPAANPYDTGVLERPSGAFRLPSQRPPDSYALGAPARPAEQDSGRIPVRGTEYPAVPQPSAEPAADPAREQEAGVYQTRRAASSVILAIVSFLLMIPVVHLLIDVTLAEDPTARTVVPAVLLTLGMTLTAMGLFAVARGGPVSRDVWLRAPGAYLPAGLILLLAAGLAVA